MSSEQFAAEVRPAGGLTEITLRGELDEASAPRARAAIHEGLAGAPRSLVLDLGGLEFMDSAGIWLVIETHRRCVESGTELRLAGERRPAVRNALVLTGVDGLSEPSPLSPPSTPSPPSRPSPPSTPPRSRTGQVHLRLYVSSHSDDGEAIARAIRLAVARVSEEPLEVEIVDVLEDPARAQRDRIIATPTLIKLEPGPVTRLIGSIIDGDAILRHLGLGHLVS